MDADPNADPAAGPAPRRGGGKGPRPPRERSPWVIPALMIVLAAAIVAGGLLARGGVGQVTDERDAAVGTAKALAPPVLDQCVNGVPVGPQPSAADCALAAQVAAAPPAQIGDGLDTARVLELIRAELAARPAPEPVLPSPDEVRAAATQVLIANPDLFRGPPPDEATLQRLAAAAATAYFTANPVQDGKDGKDGKDGDDGGPGPQGVGLASLSFAIRDGGCVAVATLVDPADGTTRETTAPVPAALCATPADPDPAPVSEDGARPGPMPLLGG